VNPLPLLSIPLFSGLSAIGKSALQEAVELRTYKAGDVILEAGQTGQWLYAIGAGAAIVRTSASRDAAAITLGPGEVFGEMSLLGQSRVSAAVIAARDSQLYVVNRQIFEKLFAEEPAFRQGVADVLATRLQLRTSKVGDGPSCAFITFPPSARALPGLIIRGVDHYVRVADVSRVVSDVSDVEALITDIALWRASSHGDEMCVVGIPSVLSEQVRALARRGDVILVIDDGSPEEVVALPGDTEATDFVMLRVGRAASRPARVDDTWSYRLDEAELRALGTTPQWNRSVTPVLDSIARWITHRTIGLALGSGAARGFAHLGVISVLEAAGIPIDCVCGSSIGGIVALLYAMSGSADGAYNVTRSALGANKYIRDISIVPRHALFRGRKVRQVAERFSSGRCFADLSRPALAVAADLITGQQVVLDRGLLAPALVATAAIPGVLPPVKSAEQWLVDGALVNRIPVDLLTRWRCGLKIAISVDTDANDEDTEVRTKLRRTLNGIFPLTGIVARSWELLGMSRGAVEAGIADIVINPRLSSHSAYDFDAFETFVTAGRRAAEPGLSHILEEVDALLRPRRG
jgi:NTE family protein